MVRLTFPDNSLREFPDGVTGRAVAEGISKSLAKKAVAMALDGELADLVRRDHQGRQDRDRHPRRSARRWRSSATTPRMSWPRRCRSSIPARRSTIGPVIENGFYYDFFRNQPFTTDDLPAIEAKMREIVARNAPFTKEVWPRDEARQVFRDKGEMFKVELVDAIPEGDDDQDLPAGRLVRPLPRSAHGLDRPGRRRLQADQGRRRLLARRLEQADADAHLRHRLGQAARSSTAYLAHARGGGEARPSPPRPRDGPLPFPGGGAGHRLLARQGLDHVPGRSSPICGGGSPATMTRSTRRSSSTSRCGRPRGTGTGFARTCSWRVRPARRPTTNASSPSSR